MPGTRGRKLALHGRAACLPFRRRLPAPYSLASSDRCSIAEGDLFIHPSTFQFSGSYRCRTEGADPASAAVHAELVEEAVYVEQIGEDRV